MNLKWPDLQLFSTHAFHSGEMRESGHDPDFYALAAHFLSLTARKFMLIPVFTVGNSSTAGSHLYLMVADRESKSVHSYCINNCNYELQGKSGESKMILLL